MAAITGDLPPGPYWGKVTNSNFSLTDADIGLIEGPIRHQQNVTALPVRCSLYGQNIIDYIIQGGGVFVVITLKEWNATTKSILWPFGTNQGLMPTTGKLMNPYYFSLTLTALTGTPAATEGPVTRVYPVCGLLPGHNIDIPFGAVERNVSLVLGVLPQGNPTQSDTINSITVPRGAALYFYDT